MVQNYWKEILDVIIFLLERARACEADLLEQRVLDSDCQRYLVLRRADFNVFSPCRFSSDHVLI